MDPNMTVHQILVALLGLAFSMPLQSFVENTVGAQLGIKYAWLKALTPSIISAALGFLATKLGVSPDDAIAAAGALVAGAHLVNVVPALAAVAMPAGGGGDVPSAGPLKFLMTDTTVHDKFLADLAPVVASLPSAAPVAPVQAAPPPIRNNV